MKRKLRSSSSSASLLALLLAAPAVAMAGTASAAQAADAVAPGDLQEALMSVSVNGSPAGDPVVLLKGADGALYAPMVILSAWRLKIDVPPAFTRGDTAFHRLNGIPGLKVELDEATQTLALHADARLFQHTRLEYADVEISDEVVGGTGAFLNYEATAQAADGLISGGGAFEAGVFTSRGVGIAGFVGRWTGERPKFIRLDTNWTIDDPLRMRSLRFGDSISRGGVGGVPLRFGGIQLARNFAVQPGFITIPLPSLSGSAALPSVVDIYVDGALRQSRDLPPGPFEIVDVPIVTGSGDVQLIVRDLLGRQVLYRQSYYAAPKLLRKGLHDYSYELGFLRQSFGRRSNDYGALMASATHRYGFSDSLTGEMHAEATKDVQTAGVAANAIVANVAHVAVSGAASRSDVGAGAHAGLTVQHQSRGLSFGVTGEFTTDDYMAVGWSTERRPPKSVIQAFAGIPMGRVSLGLSYLRRDGRSEPDAEYLAANASVPLGTLGSLNLAARNDLTDGDLSAQLLLTVPLEFQKSASAGASLTDGTFAFRSSLQKSLPAGEGFGYRFDVHAGTFYRADSRLSLQTAFGLHDAQLTWTDGKTGVRLSTSGGIGLIGGELFASRQLTQSFATVRVGGYENVRVYADNQLIGRTNSSGRVIIPRLRPFERNRLSIEVADLPFDAEILDGEQTIRPYNRHGVEVDFAAKPARAAIIRVLLEDGSPLPPGSIVALAGSTEEFVSAPGGEVYLTGLAERNKAVARWSAGQCEIEFQFIDTGEPQPRLGDVQCRSVIR